MFQRDFTNTSILVIKLFRDTIDLMSTKWREKRISLASTIISAAITLAIGVVVGLNWTNIATNVLPFIGFKKTTTNDWSELNEVYSELNNNYDGDVEYPKALEGAKKGIVASVGDKYTEYMTASEAADFEKTLHGDVGAGIGVEMALRDGYVRVMRTLPDNPASKAGILAGDIFYKVNGEDVYNLSTEEVANKVKGEAGSEVTVTLIRDGQEKTFTMTREQINNISAYVDYKGKTAVLTITRFDNDTGTVAQKLASEITSKDVDKVILDLRGNGGGYVSAAKDLLSLWIDGDAILIQKSKHSTDDTTYANRGKAVFANMKTVVLVNQTTASASEITAGALKDYGKATIVGETTYGKGVVQTLLNLSSNAILKVTTAHWYTPKGNTIDQTGIKPDVEVVKTYADTNANRDPQLDKALSL